jgi:ABC-type transport system substrate-binding protein
LKRHDDRAHVDTLVFRFVKDHTLAGTLFEKGEFDLMTFIQPVLWRSMESAAWARTGYRRLKSIDNSYSYIAWNEARPFFADRSVRRALAQLYPRDAIARSVDLGLEVPTTCPYWARSRSCDPKVEPLPYSPEAARATLADAGFSFTFLIPSSSVRLGKIAVLLQEELSRAGITMQIETVDTATLAQRVTRRDFDATSRVWTEFDAVQDQYGTFHSSQIDGGSNFAGYQSPEADRLLEQIRLETDDDRRVELERALHRRLYEDQPYLFMTSRQSLDAARVTVHGLQPSLLWYDLRKVWVEPTP